MNSSSFIKLSWFVYIAIYIVILAGGTVRITNSGMGCPDWPKCFGKWIPPTSEKELPPNYRDYLDKQDIDNEFNVYHTWTEYINRLLGAILGLISLFYFYKSFRTYYRNNNRIVFISFLLLIFMGLQGWLGKLVVDSNLSSIKITLHMIIALFIILLPLINISILKEKITISKSLRFTLLFLIVLMTIQVILGTEVRSNIDAISKSFNYQSRENWVAQLPKIFLVHRSLVWIIGVIALYISYVVSKIKPLKHIAMLLLGVFIINFGTGVMLNYFDFPRVAQLVHLLGAFLFMSVVVYLYARTKFEI